MNRWQKFKSDRAKVLDLYLKLKKKHMRGRQNFTLLLIHLILKKLSENIKAVLKLKEMRLKKFFLTIKISFLFHRKINIRGQDLRSVLTRRIKNLCTFFAASKFEAAILSAKKCIAFAIKKHFINMIVLREFKKKVTVTVQKLRMIRRIFMNQVKCRRAKEEVIHNFWDKMLAKLESDVGKQKVPDEETMLLIKRIKKVPAEVRNAVIKRYCSQVRSLHCIAFLQWRLFKYRGPKHKYRDEEMLRKLILFRIRKHLKSFNPFNQVSYKTLLKA